MSAELTATVTVHLISFDPTEAEPDQHAPAEPRGRSVRIGIGGPVGSGKTALVAALCRARWASSCASPW